MKSFQRLRLTLTFGLALLLFSCSSSPKQGKIYFVPLGDFPAQLTDELAAHYKDKFNVTIEKLPSIQLDSSMVDHSRNQMVAEGLIAVMKNKFQSLESDPNVIVIGLTQEDIYIRSYNWRFAFTFRQDDKFAVVSTARMDPVNFGDPADENLLRTRLRKMVTKNIGILYYQKPLSENPRSVLYSNVGGIEELDAMGEDF